MANQTLIFTPMDANATVWFANAAAFNDWVASILVSPADATVIPTATTTVKGLVNQAATITYTDSPLPTEVYFNLNLDQDGNGVDEVYPVPSKESYDELVVKVNYIGAKLSTLIANLKTAGIVVP